MKNILFICIDGVGDEYINDLMGTPLEYISSDLDNLNKMVREGICGLHWPVKPGIPPSSDKAHLSLFGYDIEKHSIGRGVFEALGAGLDLEEDEIAFRTNFATVEEKNNNLIVRDRRAGRIKNKDVKQLSDAVRKEIKNMKEKIEFKHTVEHRGVLTIKGNSFSPEVTDIDPHQVGVPLLSPQPLERISKEEKEEAEKTCKVLKKVFKSVYQVLKQHPTNEKRKEEGKKPANALMARGGGTIKNLPSFKEKWGLKAGYTAEAALYKGIAKSVGMKPLNVKEKLDFSGKNEKERTKKALIALKDDFDFIFLHIKLSDNFSHSKKPKKNAEFLKNLDKIFEPLLKEEDLLVILTGDHSSSSKRGRHISLPVPLLYWGDGPRDRCETFTEGEIADKGGIGIIRGKYIMPIALDLADRAEELGIRTHPSLPLYKKLGKEYFEIH